MLERLVDKLQSLLFAARDVWTGAIARCEARRHRKALEAARRALRGGRR